MSSNEEEEDTLEMSTWNISSINKNPLEYWVTHDEDPLYRTVMAGVDDFVTKPDSGDVAVQEIFTEDMFAQLEKRINGVGWDDVRPFWDKDYRHRKIISEFFLDTNLHSNRLAANLARFTDTIDVVGSNEPVCRPSVLSMYVGDLTNWWSLWQEFMFDKPLTIRRKKDEVSLIPYQMLPVLKKSKYPALTEEEEKHSLPLQLLCGAIFDAVFIEIVRKQVSSLDVWQNLKRDRTDKFTHQKLLRILEILQKTYGTSDVIFLQEVSRTFVDLLASDSWGETYWICEPFDFNNVLDQNSVVLLRKSTFPTEPTVGDKLTKLMYQSFPKDGIQIPSGHGGIVVTTAHDTKGTEYVFSSFHGSSDGSQTVPFLNAFGTVVRSLDHPTKEKKLLVVGIDANTTAKGLTLQQFTKACDAVGLKSCWGDSPKESNYTTYNARTYLQPQVHKSCTRSEVESKGNKNLKDFVLFSENDFLVKDTKKDNTGELKYINDMTYPTIDFPSDHAAVRTVLSKSSKIDQSHRFKLCPC